MARPKKEGKKNMIVLTKQPTTRLGGANIIPQLQRPCLAQPKTMKSKEARLSALRPYQGCFITQQHYQGCPCQKLNIPPQMCLGESASGWKDPARIREGLVWKMAASGWKDPAIDLGSRVSQRWETRSEDGAAQQRGKSKDAGLPPARGLPHQVTRFIPGNAHVEGLSI
jgi:hypothetical protein